MNAVAYLEAKGVQTAADVSREIAEPLVDVYAELVAAEARGLVRVVVDYSDATAGKRRIASWEAMSC